MVGDSSNRSFREMATSDGDDERSPFELPLLPVTRTADPPRTQYEQPITTPQAGTGQWRQPYGGIAPSAQTIGRPETQQTGTQQQQGQWRSPYGGIAPIAQDIGRPQQPGQPTPTPQDGQWRSPYGDVAPPARQLPPMDGTGGQPRQPGNPNDNGGATIPGDPGRWNPSGNQTGGGDMGVQPGSGGIPGQRAGADPLPTTGNGGLSAASDKQRQIAEMSLNTQLNYRTHFIEGALGGIAGSTFVPYLLDKAAWKPSLDGNRFANYWRNNHSPLGLELRTRGLDMAEIQQRNADLTARMPEAQTQLRTAAQEFRGTPGTPGTPGTATGFQAFKELHTNAMSAAAANPADAGILQRARVIDQMMQARTPAELAAVRTEIATAKNLSLVTADEARLMNDQLTKYGRVIETRNAVGDLRGQRTATTAEATALQQEMATLRQKGGNFKITGSEKTWTDSVRPGAGKAETQLTTWNGTNKWRAAGEGVGIVTAGLAANYAVDKFMPNILGLVGGADAKLPQKQQFYLQGPGVAAALLWPNKNPVWRAGAVAATVGLTTAIDWVAPQAPNATYSKLMQPNWGDALGMSTAWMLPFSNWKARALAVGTAWAGARALNAIDGVLPVPGIGDHNFGTGMNNDLTDALKSNKVTEGSFKDIVAKSHKLGMENEGQLLVQMSDFMNNKGQDPLYHLHGAAALYTAMGDLYISRGTKLDPTALNDKSRVLQGDNYDLGGQAAGLYRQALTNLVEGQNQAQKAGRTDEQKGMAEAQKDVVKRLEGLYGEHNMQNVFDKLKDGYRQNISEMTRFQVKLKQQIDGLQTRDAKYAAKMVRDLVVLDLAIAGYKAEQNDGAGASIYFAEAEKYLQAAERIDPQSADAKQLRDIGKKLAPRIPQAQQNQTNNRFNNPFGVPNGANP